jgi:Holliday junction resolvasome RuvABC endonuclease subunit
MRPSVLAFDLGTSTGWAILDEDKLIDFGQCRTRSIKSKSDYERVIGFWRIIQEAHYIALECCSTRPIIAYEQVSSHKGTYAGHVYGGLKAIMDIEFHGEQMLPLPVGTWKKLSVGSGRADKSEYIKFANDTFGLALRKRDEDMAAALCMAVAAQKILEGQ